MAVGRSAPGALARHLGVTLEANFTWMEREGVLHRGRSGRLTV